MLEVEEPCLPIAATTGESPVVTQAAPPSAVARGMGTIY